MADKQSIEFTSGMRSEAAAAYLEALAAGLRAGHISLQSDTEAAHLEVPEEIVLELEARSSAGKGKSSIELGLSWRLAKRLPAPAPALTISSDAEPPENERPATITALD
jgi:amphi-Trp domain-containing protein